MEYKFRVKDDIHSAEIQELLFDKGYVWGSGGSDCQEIQNTEKGYLFADSSNRKVMYLDKGKDNLFENDASLEAIIAHPTQLKFLETIILPGVVIRQILKNGFYLKQDVDRLNLLLQERIAKKSKKI